MIFFSSLGIAQEKKYNFSLKKDLIIIGSGIGLTTLGIVFQNNADVAILEEINALDRRDINRFDRGATSNNSSKARDISDIILYTSATLPIFAYLVPKCRFEESAVGIMALETVLITSGLTNIAKGLSQRYRPFNYNPDVDIETKLDESSRKSFFSGHTSVTASMSFLMASVITDVHPEMKNKYLIWTLAAAIPASIGYLRYEGGRHFPTDVITGYAVGATVGYLIPKLHKSKKLEINTYGISGLRMSLNLN